MRVDANVSVRRDGDTELGTRCEIKNLNSLRSLGRAIEYEARRQVDLIESRRASASGDAPLGRRRGPHPQRAQQGGGGGLPLLPRARPRAARARQDDVDRRSSPRCRPLPSDRRARLARSTGAAPTDLGVVIAVARGLDDLALAAVDAGGDPARSAQPRRAQPRGRGRGVGRSRRRSRKLTRMEVDGALTATQAKTVLAELVNGATDPAAVAAEQRIRSDGHVGARVDRRRGHRRQPRHVGTSSSAARARPVAS